MIRTARMMRCTPRPDRDAKIATVHNVGRLRNSIMINGCLQIVDVPAIVWPATILIVRMIHCTKRRKIPVATAIIQRRGNRRILITSNISGLTGIIRPNAAPVTTTPWITSSIPVTGAMNIQDRVLLLSTGRKGSESSATVRSVTGAVTKMRLRGCGEKRQAEVIRFRLIKKKRESSLQLPLSICYSVVKEPYILSSPVSAWSIRSSFA